MTYFCIMSNSFELICRVLYLGRAGCFSTKFVSLFPLLIHLEPRGLNYFSFRSLFSMFFIFLLKFYLFVDNILFLITKTFY